MIEEKKVVYHRSTKFFNSVFYADQLQKKKTALDQLYIYFSFLSIFSYKVVHLTGIEGKTSCSRVSGLREPPSNKLSF